MTDLKNNLEEVWREEFESLFNEKYNQSLYGHTLKQWTTQDLMNQEFKFGLNYYIEARKKAQEEINSLRSAYKKNIDSLGAGLSEDLLKILKTYPTALPYICEIKQELQKTKEQFEDAIQLLRRTRNACSPSDIAACEQALKDFLEKQDKENKE